MSSFVQSLETTRTALKSNTYGLAREVERVILIGLTTAITLGGALIPHHHRGRLGTLGMILSQVSMAISHCELRQMAIDNSALLRILIRIPWLLAIILAGDENRLHLRVYFEQPPAELADRGTAQLPDILQDKINTLTRSEAGSSFVNCSNTTPPPVRAKNLVIEVEEALTRNPNVLLIGPPGSSKSVALEDLNKLYSSNSAVSAVLFDPDSWNGDWAEVNEPLAKCISLTFHAAYMYENFVAGLYPKSFPEGGIKLEAIPGPLLCMSHWVGHTERKGLLILDEFNRGHAAAIFGDTLSLLDKEKRSTSTNDGAHILRPYSEQPMPVPDSFRRGEADQEEIEQNVRIPANVHIVAAMNSTDRSVAPLDAALRRRFAVIRVLPDYEVLASHFKIDIQRAEQPLPSSHEVTDWEVDDVSALAVKLLRHLNERIEFCLGEDFLLGHGLLWDLESDDKKERLKQLTYCVDHFVVPTLRTIFIDQDDALAAVLGISTEQQANGSTASPITGSVAYWKIAPAGLTDIVAKRLVIQEIHKMGINHQVAALVALSSSS